jgi:hypothetical protein
MSCFAGYCVIGLWLEVKLNISYVQPKLIHGAAVAMYMAQLCVWLGQHTGGHLGKRVWLNGQVVSVDDVSAQLKFGLPSGESG